VSALLTWSFARRSRADAENAGQVAQRGPSRGSSRYDVVNRGSAQSFMDASGVEGHAATGSKPTVSRHPALSGLTSGAGIKPGLASTLFDGSCPHAAGSVDHVRHARRVTNLAPVCAWCSPTVGERVSHGLCKSCREQRREG